MKRPGMDTPEHVKDWFLAKGHPFLVFRLADILELDNEYQLLFLDVNARAGSHYPAHPDLDMRAQVQNAGHRGFAKISVKQLCKVLRIEDLQAVQALCYAYRDVRQGKLEPCVIEPCNCGGERGCMYCAGTGTVTVLVEMSAVETALSEGKDWEQIDKEGLT